MIPRQVEDVAGRLCGPVSSSPVTTPPPPSQSSLKSDAMSPSPRKVTAEAVGLYWGPTWNEQGQFGAAAEQVRQTVHGDLPRDGPPTPALTVSLWEGLVLSSVPSDLSDLSRFPAGSLALSRCPPFPSPSCWPLLPAPSTPLHWLLSGTRHPSVPGCGPALDILHHLQSCAQFLDQGSYPPRARFPVSQHNLSSYPKCPVLLLKSSLSQRPLPASFQPLPAFREVGGAWPLKWSGAGGWSPEEAR